MSELTISATPFVIQPLANLRDGPAELRWWYSRSFLSSEGVQVNWGTGKTGFWVTTPCAVADGLIVVEQDTLLWTTDDAQDTSPLTIFLSAGIFTVRGQLVQQLQIANKTQWTVLSALAPTTTWEDFSIANQATSLYYYNPDYLNAPQTIALIDNSFDQHPASDTELGTVLLTIPADQPAQPVVWGANDPLVRDAIAIQGVAVDDTAPLDTQALIYNAALNEWQPGNQNPGTGNVVSNEIASVDGEITLFSGTGGKTIRRGDQTGLLRGDAGVVSAATQAESTLTGRGEGSGAGVLESLTLGSGLTMTGTVLAAPGASGGDIKADGTVPFAADESMGGFKLTNLATPDDLTDAANKDFVLSSVAAAVQQTPNISALVSGGGVLWESAYNFRVSAATYLIQGDLFTSAEQTITLDAADPTLDRIDVIALDNTGTVVKITGTAAAQPSQPDVDPGSQLLLTFVFVAALSTEPTITNEDIYIDNTEWTATTSGSGWDPNSTNNPHSGTKDIEGTAVANNAYVQLEAPAPLALDTFDILSVFIRSKATWPKNRSLLFQWYSAGVAKGVAITINTGFFGFDSSQVATYQLLAIPLGQFAVPAGTSINQLRITDKGGAIGMYIDDLVLQDFGGDVGPPPSAGLTQEQGDARYLQQASNLSDVVSASTARTNLGLGALATVVPGTGIATFLTTPSSANLAAALTDETGTGAAVFGTSPVFTTDITLPNGSAPTTGSVAKVAFDTDAWAASRGAVQVHDGTANTFLVGVLASDTPSNGQVPTWNTGGTVTWETPSAGGGTNPTSTVIPYNNAGTFADSNIARAGTDLTEIVRGTNAQTVDIYKSLVSPTEYTRLRIESHSSGIALVADHLNQSSPNIIFKNTSGTDGVLVGNGVMWPTANQGFSLGGSSNRWNQAFVQQFIAYDTGTAGFLFNGGPYMHRTASGTMELQDPTGAFNKIHLGLGQANVNVAFVKPASVQYIESRLGDESAFCFMVGAGTKFTSAQFDKTNTTLADVTGLTTEALVAGKTYGFEAVLFVDADITGGSKYAIAGTATATAIKYEIVLLADATNLITISSRQTALGGSAGQAGTTAGLCRISGTITVNAAGTLTVQFAQNAANGTSSVLTMSNFKVWQIN